MRKSRLGLPYLEFALAVVLGCILVLVCIERYWYYRELAEKAVFEMTVHNLRSGLRLEQARRILAGESLQTLEHSNPVHYLEKAPENYNGELTQTDTPLVRKSGWTFVRKDGTLYYQPLINRHLQANLPLALRIDGDLKVVTQYQWF